MNKLGVWVVVMATVMLFASCTRKKSDLGEQHFLRGEYQEAIDEYNKVLAIRPRSLEEMYNRGRAYQELHNEAKAVEDFENVLKLNPDHVQAHLSLGNIDFNHADYEGAFFQYNEVVKKYNQNSEGLTYRGKANFKLGNVRAALQDYDNAIRINPKNGQAYLYRGALNIQTKRPKKACIDFRKAELLGIPEAVDAIKKYCH